MTLEHFALFFLGAWCAISWWLSVSAFANAYMKDVRQGRTGDISTGDYVGALFLCALAPVWVFFFSFDLMRDQLNGYLSKKE